MSVSDEKKITVLDSKKRKKKIIKIVVIALAIFLVLIITLNGLAKSGNKTASSILEAVGIHSLDGTNEANVNSVYVASRRDITNILTGTGTLKPYDEYTVSALSSGEIVEDFFEEGENVNKDQILMKIDSSNLESSLERAQNTYENALEALEDLIETKKDLNIISDYAGVIQVMNFEEGDSVRAGDVIASIIDRDVMLIDIPFMQEDTFNIKQGSEAILTVADTLEQLQGVVKKISPAYKINTNGVKVVDVTVAVKNPGVITERTTTTAKIGNYSCTNSANFYYNVNKSVVSELSGKIENVVTAEGEYISESGVILTLSSEDIDDSIRKAERSVKEARKALEDAKEAFENYEITAPISGTVVSKNYKKGEKIGGAQGGSTIATIYDLSALKFEMNIDELDIDNLAVGNEVEVTSDAKPGMKYTGRITKISVQGNTSGGTTYYPITVTLTDYGQNDNKALRPGMNIDAEIIIERVDNVIAVPVDAVGRGNKVKVVNEKDVNTENMTVSSKAEYKEVVVKTGISDGSFIEITEGINENDVVICESSAISTGWKKFGEMMGNMSMGGGMGPGNMGGSMPR